MRPIPALALCASLLCAAPAMAALTHRYSFNDGTANDSVGGAHGVLVNGAPVTGGRLAFDPAVNTGFNSNPATGQYLDLPNNIAGTRVFTLEVWTTYRGGSRWQRILDFGNNSSGVEILPSDKTTLGYHGVGFIILSPRNGLNFPVAQVSVHTSGGDEDTDWVGANFELTRNVEHHIVFGHDPDAGIDSLWIDGQLAGLTEAEHDASVADYRNYWLGRSNFQQDAFYNGTINEFRIYDHRLTIGEVSANFAAGPDVLVPEPSALAPVAVGALGLLRRRRSA